MLKECGERQVRLLTRVTVGAAVAIGLGTGGHTENVAASTPIVDPAIIAQLPETATPLAMPLRRDSVELVFSGTQQQVDSAMKIIGYKVAEKSTVASRARAVGAACSFTSIGKRDPTGPNPEDLIGIDDPTGNYYEPDTGSSQQTIAPRHMVSDWPTKFNKLEVGVAADILKENCVKPFDQDPNIDGQRNQVMKKFTQAGYAAMLEGTNLGKNKRQVTLANGTVAYTDGLFAVVDVTRRNK